MQASPPWQTPGNREKTDTMTQKKLSIQEIAHLANVSKTTVSRVINHKPDVKPETRQMIEDIINANHYYPNALAQAFSQQKNRTVALVLSNHEAYVLSNPYYAELIQGIMQKARERNYHLILSYFSEDDCFALVRQHQCDGVLVLTPDSTHREKLEELIEMNIPVVSTARVPGMTDLHYVAVDEYSAACKIVEHVLLLGHRKVGVINGPKPLYSTSARMRGYRAALKKHGIAFRPEIVTYGDTTPESGRDNMKKLLETDGGITAVFVCSDMMAIGAKKAIEERGMRVPDDISLISTDATAIGGCLDAPLTTMKQPTIRRGELAMQMLVDLIEGREVPMSTMLPMDIVIRKTTAAPHSDPEGRRK